MNRVYARFVIYMECWFALVPARRVVTPFYPRCRALAVGISSVIVAFVTRRVTNCIPTRRAGTRKAGLAL